MFDITQEEDYRELTLEEQYLVNGGKEIENSIAAQADASVGDTVTDSNGKTSTLTQGDINWAREQIEASGSGGNPGASSGSPDNGPSGNPGNGSDNSSNNNNPFANSNTPWGADEQMEAARLAKEKGKEFVANLEKEQKKFDIYPSKITEMKDYLKDEGEVKKYLEQILENPENYAIAAYERTAISKGKRNALKKHSFYVITNLSTKEKTTLSFNGTELNTKSKGAWVLNTETDIDSYKDFRFGKSNDYDMKLLRSPNSIDTSEVAGNIINSINSSTQYYLFDHIIDKEGYNNCNTALYSTITKSTYTPGNF